ncbi:dCTP deaminase [Cystobacter ferrugineus]|uniref:dCTP deaminase n=1 Tax=Cystobacter ferrugineus TaxID=83449 RepID=A0A1L9B127_9BACT|nr:dCTP deaminase [Cystobacter ferrugineus]OJH35969.1 dCTP deaminase [Cystobacter ferrugineus]
MILTGPKIQQEVLSGTIRISPFCEEQVNPNSYDFRLGDTLKVYKKHVLDTKKLNETTTLHIPPEGIELRPDTLYLGHTMESVGSDKFVPVLRGKSSTGRIGLFVHITADLIDIGSYGQFTLMLHAVQPVRIYPRMRIGQVTFWTVLGDITLYQGKYQGSNGPRESEVYRDFDHREHLP